MEAKRVWFDTDFIYVETTENTIGKMPLVWFPRLKKASEAALQQFELWADNTWIHWEDIGEDLSVEGFFSFRKENIGIQP
jgi:hypothetical protein